MSRKQNITIVCPKCGTKMYDGQDELNSSNNQPPPLEHGVFGVCGTCSTVFILELKSRQATKEDLKELPMSALEALRKVRNKTKGVPSPAGDTTSEQNSDTMGFDMTQLSDGNNSADKIGRAHV